MHTNKLCNLDEMDNLGICDVRKTQKLPSLNHEKTDWMSRIMTSRDWISNQKSPVKEKPEAWWPHWWIPPNISKRTNTNPQIVPDIKEKETIPNSFYVTGIILIPKSDKDTRKLLMFFMNNDAEKGKLLKEL